MADRIRVLVVDDGAGLTRELSFALAPRGPVRVAGPVDDVAAVIDQLTSGLADLVVVHIDRPDGLGTERIAAIAAGGGRGRVLAASRAGGPDVAARALSAGACGVLPPQRDRSLIDVFRRALAGELVLPADDLSNLVDRLMPPAGGSRGDPVADLTDREREILRSLAAGASTADVAEAFGISPLTVQSHVKSILAKLGVHSKVEAVRIAWRHGLASASRSA
ncbi:MAG: LuxR C-terminal-related transcriptional regulator [Actinomycetota bacterium]